MEPEIAFSRETQSLWTGPRDDPRRYRVDFVDGILVSMGDGGEGLVFRATTHFEGHEREVALKMHTSLTLDDFERFSRRAHALPEVDHPNVMHMIEVFIGTGLVDCDESPEEDFNVMYTVADWIPGLSLPVALEATSAASGLHWVSEVARATSYLHNFRSADAPEGLIHRDIKPSNVRITTDERAVLIDFGIARPHQKGDLTEGAGTYLWRAPEVVGGPGDPGPASDVWGVGALGYWVLLGEPPRLEGADTARKLLAPAASQAGFVDPPGLSSCISELLETHPKDRPTDLARWADELELSVAGKRRRRINHRPTVFVALAAIALIAAAAVALVATGPSGVAATKSAVFAFKPQSFVSGLIVDRTWKLSGVAGDQLQGSATLIDGDPGTLKTSYDEVLPRSVASSVRRVSFSPPDEQILQPDPVVRYRVDLTGGGSEKIGFTVNIGPTDGGWSTRLRDLAEAQEAAEASYLAATDQTAPATLKSLQITPSRLTLTTGQSQPVTLAGAMSDGKPATSAALAGVAWSTSAATTATAFNGTVYGLTAGNATITAQAGSASATLTVTVTASAGQSSSSGASAPSPSPSSPHNTASGTPSSSPSPSATGTKGATQTPGSSAGSAPATTTTQAPAPVVTTPTTTTTPSTSSRTITVFGPWSNTGLLISPNNTADDSFLFDTTIANISEICVDFSYYVGMPPGGGLQWTISGLGGAGLVNSGTTTITSDTSSCIVPQNQGNWAALTDSLANGQGDLSIAWQNAGTTTPTDSSLELSQGTMTITGSFG